MDPSETGNLWTASHGLDDLSFFYKIKIFPYTQNLWSFFDHEIIYFQNQLDIKFIYFLVAKPAVISSAMLARKDSLTNLNRVNTIGTPAGAMSSHIKRDSMAAIADLLAATSVGGAPKKKRKPSMLNILTYP